MDKGKISGDNFYKRIGSARSTHNNSQNNFYISSNKKEIFSTLIQIVMILKCINYYQKIQV